MSTHESDQLEVENSAQPVEETRVPEPATEEALSEPQRRAWYRVVNEDWLATVVGLILVVLIVIRLFHNIP